VDNVTKARTQNPTYSPDGKYLAYQYVPDPASSSPLLFSSSSSSSSSRHSID
jgi:Tol biopolymer transport system component